MLISGGIPLEWDWKPTDPWVSALGIVDMTSLQWSDSYDAKAAEYDSPQKIKDWYNNGCVSPPIHAMGPNPRDANWVPGTLPPFPGAPPR